jgi:hypothetical protein
MEPRQMTQSELYAYMMPLRAISEKNCLKVFRDSWQEAMFNLLALRLVHTFIAGEGARYFAISQG